MNTQEKEYVLSTLDRCDKCYAQAWVVVKGNSGELYFCGHHYEANENTLKKWGIKTIDERFRLTKP